MMMFLATERASVTSSVFHSLWTPLNFFGLGSMPNPPFNTWNTERF